MYRTHYCGELNATLAGQKVTVAGWVHTRRDHGKMIFIDLRDAKGLVQVIIAKDAAASYELAKTLRAEYVVSITGLVQKRSEKTINLNLPRARWSCLRTTL